MSLPANIIAAIQQAVNKEVDKRISSDPCAPLSRLRVLKGESGRTILSGQGAPHASDGVVGDFYVDKDTLVLYGPKQVAGWGVGTGLKADHDYRLVIQQSACLLTTADHQPASSLVLSNTPIPGTLTVDIGITQQIGNGTRTADCYFSGDNGATAQPINSIVAGDKLYWNGSIAGFQLSVDDFVVIQYRTTN